ALAGLGAWAAANRPVSPPDVTGRVAGLAFSPFQRGQSPEDGRFPSVAQIEADLRAAAALTGPGGQIRSYTVAGDMARLPALAAVDVSTSRWLPYEEGIPRADERRFVQEELRAVQAAYPGRRVVIGEIGWPSNGVDIGPARASRQDQAIFMRGFMQQAQARR